MINITDKEECSGCGACMNACAHHCITMKEDKEGFKYPRVDKERCIECGLCDRICPVKNPINENTNTSPLTLSAKAKNNEIRIHSSSGGLFSLLANHVIQSGGIVFGATYNKELGVEHTIATTEQDVLDLRGSKYVQSDTKSTFSEVKQYLKEGRKVLYVGTPCQIEGLLSYLRYKNIDNLYTVDFVCHGVPSPKIWRKYLDSVERRYGEAVEKSSNRDKRHGWKTYSITLVLSSMSKSRILTFDKYLQTFLRDVSLRPSCYKCAFKKINRVSDLTLADFWGIGKIRKEFDDDKGISLVLIHSDKGRKILDSIKSEMDYNEEPLDFVKKINHNMVKSASIPKMRKNYFENIDNYSFDELYKRYVQRGLLYELKNRTKGYLKLLLHYTGIKY